MPKQLTRVSDVLKHQLRGVDSITDAKIDTTCPGCNVTQHLSESVVVHNDGETTYTCKNGCQTLVIIGDPGGRAWEGRGYRLGSSVIRNAVDLFVDVGAPQKIGFPASKNALATD
jgi:hypothetical protein